ncbi:hypothetical protein CHUAL_010139 [Chamberlinius hualienensis]
MKSSVPILIIISGFLTNTARSLDCFKCVSVGSNYPACEDPFHNNYTVEILESPCMGGRKDRDGLFPATACLKLSGVFEDTGEPMVVRGCGLDSGTLTVDTEIVRMSHCGGFYFDKRYVRGCVMSCPEDACNKSVPTLPPINPITVIVTSFAVYAMIYMSQQQPNQALRCLSTELT